MQNETPDLTVVYLTANEHPEHWTAFHLDKLVEAAGNYPIILSTIKPLGWGLSSIRVYPKFSEVIIQTEEYSHYSMYRQLLKAAKMATTPYIAVAESDVLYSPEHFTFFRPKMDEVAYDMSKWSLYTWRPVFTLKRRMSNALMIAPREYLIDALEERYGDSSTCPRDRAGEIGRHIHEKALGIKLRNAVEVWCYHPSVILTHENAIGFKQAHHPYQKTLGELKADSIPDWGSAEELAKNYR